MNDEEYRKLSRQWKEFKDVIPGVLTIFVIVFLAILAMVYDTVGTVFGLLAGLVVVAWVVFRIVRGVVWLILTPWRLRRYKLTHDIQDDTTEP